MIKKEEKKHDDIENEKKSRHNQAQLNGPLLLAITVLQLKNKKMIMLLLVKE